MTKTQRRSNQIQRLSGHPRLKHLPEYPLRSMKIAEKSGGRQEIIISVFVASPSDVKEERGILEEVISEQNKTWARSLGIRLELINWETHAYPGFGEDPQAVINERIPQDFDLFIGLMWHKFGTPTGRSGSGTIEEFQRAKKRFNADPSSLQLMIYFKDAPISPSKIDSSQLDKVANFRATLGDQGGLYWSFLTSGDFENLVRRHLAQFVQDWHSKAHQSQFRSITSAQKEDSSPDGCIDHDEEDEPGLLDLADQLEDDFSSLTEIAERISDATAELGKKMRSRTSEIGNLAESSNSPSRKAVKRLTTNAASDMDQYVRRMEEELPHFSQLLKSGTNTLSRMSALLLEFNADHESTIQIEDNLIHVRKFLSSMTSAKESLTGFRDSVVSIPRMTATLNRSKRTMAKVIQQLIDELHSAESMTRKAEALLVSSSQRAEDARRKIREDGSNVTDSGQNVAD